jgi:hypothetical protein
MIKCIFEHISKTHVKFSNCNSKCFSSQLVFHVKGLLISQCGISEVCNCWSSCKEFRIHTQKVQTTTFVRWKNPQLPSPNLLPSAFSLSLSLSLSFSSPNANFPYKSLKSNSIQKLKCLHATTQVQVLLVNHGGLTESGGL